MNFIKEKILKLSINFLRYSLNIPENSSIIILSGGLGNQLFQYSLGLHLEKKYDKNIFFYDSSHNYTTTHSTSITRILKRKLNFIKSEKIPNLIRFTIFSKYFLKLNNFLFRRFNKKLFPILFLDHPLKKINIDSEPIKSNSLSIFFGTWHTTINSYDAEIFSNFNFPKKFKLPNTINNLAKLEFISLHIRRGDYISQKKAAKFHGNLKNQYYINSVNYIRSNFENLPVYIFTDDPKWVSDNFQPLINNSFLISEKSQDAEVDFFLMSKAKYFVISNSTFSWWAAFYSESKDKFIILPKNWFKKDFINPNLIYKEWSYKIIE